MKRERDQVFDQIAMANCLMLLSRRGGQFDQAIIPSHDSPRVFECKTCNRQFPSFQALGGHRASHKKPRLGAGLDEMRVLHEAKPKTHECSVCGVEFAIGQALGGHMRRHRSVTLNKGHNKTLSITSSSSSGSSSLDSDHKINSTDDDNKKRVLFLDLNLTPLENDSKFLKIGMPNSSFEISDLSH